MKPWFVTGASRGFGRKWTAAALERGDRVAAMPRDPSSLDDLVATDGDAIPPLRWQGQPVAASAHGAVAR